MKIEKFQNLIQQLPYEQQSFDVNRKTWEKFNQTKYINRIFENKQTININRFDLINSNGNIADFILKTLMWGYPTGGRGNNITNLLEEENFNRLEKILETYKNQEITISQLKKDIKSINGLALSTITKFTHFLDTTIEGKRAVILDFQIIKAINTGRFEEFNSLKGISYQNAPNRYLNYLKIVNELSEKLKVEPDQIEMFLFTFGRLLSEPQKDKFKY